MEYSDNRVYRWASFDRGEARAITLYEKGQPARICFAGWTLDAPAAGNGSFEDARGKRPPLKRKVAPQPISAEEREADLHHGFQADFQRIYAIFCKYQNDTDFLQSILNLRPDILARALSGIKK